MDANAICSLHSKLESLTIDDSQDLGEFLDNQDDINTQLGWAGQNISQ